MAMSVNEIAWPRPAPDPLEALRKKLKEHAMSAGNITTIGIDLGKNTFHLAGLDKRGAIAPQRKVSRRAPDPGAARQTVPQEQLP